MPNVKISQLPHVGKTGYTSNDIVPFVSYINPTGTTSETKIDDLKDYVLDNTFIQNIIRVGKGGNVDFTSLYDAIQSITGSSLTNRFVIEVGPGIYVESPIDVSNKPYVSIVGSDINSVVILPDNPSNTIVKLGNTGHISFLTISGATSGIGILCEDLDGFVIAHKISMYDNDVQINVVSSIANTQFFGEYIDLNGLYTYGVYVKANNPTYVALSSLENHFNFPTGSATIANFSQGSGAQLTFNGGDCVGINTPGSIAFRSEDYSNLLISSVGIRGWDVGIDFPNIGGPCYFNIDGVTILNSNSYDLRVNNTLTVGTIQGSLGQQYISNNSESVFWNFLDNTNGELEITGKLSVTFKDGTHTDLSTLLFESGTMGVLEGGVITIVSGLTISVSEGFGYLETILDNSIIKRYDWLDTPYTLSPNQNQYIYINNNGILSNSGSRPNSIYNIILGRVVTNSTDIIMIDSSPLNANHTSNLYDDLFGQALGPIYKTGSIVTENVTPYHLDVTGGDYFYSTNQYLPSGGSDITFTMYYGDGTTGWTTSATTEVVNGYDDGSGTISPLSLGVFTKHTLYVIGEGVNEQYFLVLGQTQYETLIQTEDDLLPIPPPYFDDSVTQIASIYIQQGSVNIIGIEDIRPVIGFKAGGINASSLHGNLLGLNADDHTQYLLVDGSRAMEGNINMGGNDIYSATSVTSNVISATTYQNLPPLLPLTGGSITGDTTVVGSFRVTGNTTTYGNLTGLGESSTYIATPWATNPGDYDRFLQRFYLKLHPEGSSNFIPYFINDIGYLTLRGGSVTSNYTGITQSQIETIFDGTPKYATFNPSLLGTGMTLNILFGETLNFTNQLSISFGANNWRAQDFTIELSSGGTYTTLDVVTGYTDSDYLIKFSLTSPNTFDGCRITFSNFFNTVSPTGFRIADISLMKFNSNGPKSLYVGRDGGEIYKQIQITGGTVTEPPYSTLNNTNTGMYFPASDTIGWVTNGVERVRIDSSGNTKVNGNLTVTGNTSLQGLTATTIDSGTVTVTNTSGTPSRAASFDSTGKLVAGLGQTTFSAFGTSALVINNTTTTFTIVPGLTQTLTVPANCSVYVVTTGGIGNTNGTNYSFTADFSIFVDGVGLTQGGYGRVNTFNPVTTNAAFTNTTWSISTILNLSAGSHTIDLRVVYRNTSNAAQGASVSSPLGSVRQGELYIMVIKN